MQIIQNSLRQVALGKGWFRLQFLWQDHQGTAPINLLYHPGLGLLEWQGNRYSLADLTANASPQAEAVAQTQSKIRAVMAGTVAEMAVKAGDQVTEGELLCILEAMKMRLEVTAPRTAQVQAIAVKEAETVHLGQVLLELD